MQTDRYHRQTVLPQIGDSGQRRLFSARVLCVGVGGLGCASLPYLVAAGVGHITILDDDRVTRSNLQRQILFSDADAGLPKCEAAAQRLHAMNPEVRIDIETSRLSIENLNKFFDGQDLVIDGSDNFSTKYLLADASVKFKVPLVYASATAMEAHVTVFDPHHGPCLRCLFPSPPAGWVPNCSEAGILGPVVGMAGCIQATEAIKLLLDNDSLTTLSGRLWVLDATDMSSRQLHFERREDCRTCGVDLDEIDLTKDSMPTCSPESAIQCERNRFIDVRDPEEWRYSHIAGAVNLPLSRILVGELPSFPLETECIVYCARGIRSETAVRMLRQAGFHRARSLRGGLAAWTGPREGARPGREYSFP